MQRILAVLISTALCAACGEEPGAPAAGDLEMIYWAGDAQVGPCYTELPEPVVVRLLDPDALPIVGQAVAFGVLEGDGWTLSDSTTSDSLGFAVNYWTVGRPGPQVLEARATSATGTGQFARITATATPADLGERRIALVDVNNPVSPDVSGDRIVYVARRNGRFDVYLYDLAADTERRITTDASTPWDPRISGDRIVWDDWRSGASGIYLYDLTSGTERRITTDAASPGGPAIDDGRIVWQDSRTVAGVWGIDIYLYDLATETERRITTDTARQLSPVISGDRIVWVDRRHGGLDVYLYDLESGTERWLATGSGVGLSGNRVVYQRWGTGAADVFVYDLASGLERRITTDASDPCCPAIAGDRIVWIDWRRGKPDLYLYDLTTETERRLATGLDPSINPSTPAISGDHIVWEDDRTYRTSGSYDPEVYLYDLESACVAPVGRLSRVRGP